MNRQMTEKERIERLKRKTNLLKHPSNYDEAIKEFSKYKSLTPTAGKRLIKARRWLEEDLEYEMHNRNSENIKKISRKIKQIDELLKKVAPVF